MRSGDRPWSNYVRGVAWALQAQTGDPAAQVDLALHCDVPMGAGLSSSAALEVATGLVLAAAAQKAMRPLDRARMARRTESGFVGVPCGIMDQFISCLGREDHALLIDCLTEEAKSVPLDLVRMAWPWWWWTAR